MVLPPETFVPAFVWDEPAQFGPTERREELLARPDTPMPSYEQVAPDEDTRNKLRGFWQAQWRSGSGQRMIQQRGNISGQLVNEQLDDLFSQIKPVPLVLYRGGGGTLDPDDIVRRHKAGKRIVIPLERHKGFSTDPKVAQRFAKASRPEHAGKILMRVYAEQGGVPLQGRAGGEGEVVLPRGTQLHVVHVEEGDENSPHVVHAVAYHPGQKLPFHATPLGHFFSHAWEKLRNALSHSYRPSVPAQFSDWEQPPFQFGSYTTSPGYTHAKAPRGGITIQGRFYPGGEWIPKEVLQQAGLASSQQQGGGPFDMPSASPGGGGMPMQQDQGMPMDGEGGGGPSMAPPATAASPPPRPMRRLRPVSGVREGEESPHLVAQSRSWLSRVPHLADPEDRTTWLAIHNQGVQGPAFIASLLGQTARHQGKNFGRWVSKGIVQTLGDQSPVLHQLPPDQLVGEAVFHPEIMDWFRRYSRDRFGETLQDPKVLHRAVMTAADDPEFGQMVGRIMSGAAQQFADDAGTTWEPMEEVWQFDVPPEYVPPRLENKMLVPLEKRSPSWDGDRKLFYGAEGLGHDKLDRRFARFKTDDLVGQHYTPDDQVLTHSVAKENGGHWHELRLHDHEGNLAGTFDVGTRATGTDRRNDTAHIGMTKIAAAMQRRGLGHAMYLLAMHHLPYEWFHSELISDDAKALRARLLAKGLIEYHPEDPDLVRLTPEGHNEAEKIKELHAPGVGFHTASWRYGANRLGQFSEWEDLAPAW